ncbi:MAG TPA: hypothetical protein VFR99_05010 [Marmoricola sp.]|nr:hypothetical protein [Marmoricola sp.]
MATSTFEVAGPVGPEATSPREGSVGTWALVGVVVASLGGPLALAALYAPHILADASASAGLATLAAAVVFVAPLAVWLGYSRHLQSGGGLFAFVEAAAGRRVALVQGSLWVVSYLLYLLTTTAEIAHDVLPAAVPGGGRHARLVEIAVPVALVAVALAGRRVALGTLGMVGFGQLGLTALLAGVALAHVGAPAASFAAEAPAGPLATATAQTSLLYVCGSLPLFLGGEVRRPAVTMRRGLVVGYLLSAALVVLAVFPLAARPGVSRAGLPGVDLLAQFTSRPVWLSVGVGVAVSIAGVMLVEYVALTRLLHHVTGRSLRGLTVAVGVVVLASAPLTLAFPELYDHLLKPSLIALWLSQLVVFVVYPRFARRHGSSAVLAWSLAVLASVFAGYGMWATLGHHIS